jgi:hypothetical protein
MIKHTLIPCVNVNMFHCSRVQSKSYIRSISVIKKLDVHINLYYNATWGNIIWKYYCDIMSLQIYMQFINTKSPRNSRFAYKYHYVLFECRWHTSFISTSPVENMNVYFLFLDCYYF